MSNANSKQSNRKPKEIEAELSDTRTRLDRTLDAIEHRLTPGQMFDQVTHYFRESGGGLASNFSNTVQNNPMPVTLLGVSLAWLMISNNSAEPAPKTEGNGKLRGAVDGASAKAQGAREGVGNAAGGARERAGQMSQSARDGMGRLGQSGRDQTQRARDGFDYMLQEQPLVLGALGIALGAALGSGLPATRREDELMGETRDDAVRRASETGQDYAERAKSAAQAGQKAAAEESQRQGLSGNQRPA